MNIWNDCGISHEVLQQCHELLFIIEFIQVHCKYCLFLMTVLLLYFSAHTSTGVFYSGVCVCVCVLVFERERGRGCLSVESRIL